MAKSWIERGLERGLFASRWLMAPFYVGLIAALIVLLISFGQELVVHFHHLDKLTPEKAILMALSLIDLSLAANLVVIVIFSGYENFVSKLNIGDHEDRPEWMGTVDFSALKLKLIASIVAISGIALLKEFLNLTTPVAHEGVVAVAPVLDQTRLLWLVIVHLTFIGSGVMLALMDYVSGRSKKH